MSESILQFLVGVLVGIGDFYLGWYFCARARDARERSR